MSENNCTHDCSSCSADCASRKPESFLKEPHAGSVIRKAIAVVSGKGGVGKSLTASLLASYAHKQGKSVGIMDADITGAVHSENVRRGRARDGQRGGDLSRADPVRDPNDVHESSARRRDDARRLAGAGHFGRRTAVLDGRFVEGPRFALYRYAARNRGTCPSPSFRVFRSRGSSSSPPRRSS